MFHDHNIEQIINMFQFDHDGKYLTFSTEVNVRLPKM